ncbi:unnamed protein product [Calicophoron daubneyi]|uniref:DIS3-like exonuclease 1 n=1 Tax=Calicophoron daubneyi TaxID=300641 RepID=A0AAV2TLV8_CALDB
MSSVYSILRDRSEKIVRYKTPRGKEVCLTREVYLRDDVCCKCSVCKNPHCQSSPGGGHLLPAELKLYVIVDGNYALHYWEIFELEDIKGIILTLTTANFVQQQAATKRPYKRLRASLEDPAHSCILFDNEFHKSCFRCPLFDESALDFTSRMNWIAANWYQRHLGSSVCVVLVSDNRSTLSPDAVKAIQPLQTSEGATVMTLPELLQVYYPTLRAAQLLFESLHASLQTKTADLSGVPGSTAENGKTSILPTDPGPGNVYPAHLPESALLAGLRSGQFIRGVLRVSRFRASTEAMVTLTDASVVKHQPELKEALASRSEIAVHGMQYRNRAIDGDQVVIRLLPRAQWTSVSSNISASENCAAEVMETTIGAAECRKEEECVASTPALGPLPCGFVVGIASRNWRDYVCTYVKDENAKGTDSIQEVGWILATPWDRRVPRIRLHTTQASVLARERFVVRIDSWDACSSYPNGHFVQSLGRIGDLETETQTLLIEHNLAIRAFNDAQLAELAPYSARRPWCADPKEVKLRRDLRSPAVSGNPLSEDLLVFSIDPEGCQDVDDTLSVKWLTPIQAEDGTQHRRLQLGVHIADVTYFVPFGGFVDAEAKRRSTSIYLADRRYDMLPGILSGDICSLWSGVDRYAVSVIWEIDMDTFDVLDTWFGRTIIRSSYKMSYEVAQRLYNPDPSEGDAKSLGAGDRLLKKMGGIDEVKKLIPELKDLGTDAVLTKLTELENAIKLLVEVASNIRTRRVARGGLELDSIEISVRFEDQQTRSGKLEDLIPKEPLEMHGTVAELMIFANHWVARRCLESYPERSCLRRHPPPRPEFFEELQQCAASRGIALDVGSNRALSSSLALANDPKDPEVKKVLLQLTTRAMANALYFSTGANSLTREQFAHYGLALNLYTHFTSPIRRYADMIVHRILLTSLGDCRSAVTKPTAPEEEESSDRKDNLFTSEELSAICQHMNEQHWAAQQVQRSSTELFQALFFRSLPETDPLRRADGIICQLRGDNGFVVLVSRFGVRGAVCIKDHSGRIAWAQDAGGTGPISWVSSEDGYQVTRIHRTGTTDCGHLEVRKMATNETQTYRVFDHVTVSIHVSESVAHGLGLRLELLTGPRASTKDDETLTVDPKQVKTGLIESVRATNAERLRKRAAEEAMTEDAEGVALDQDALISKLHDPTSIYHRFHKMLRTGVERN